MQKEESKLLSEILREGRTQIIGKILVPILILGGLIIISGVLKELEDYLIQFVPSESKWVVRIFGILCSVIICLSYLLIRFYKKPNLFFLRELGVYQDKKSKLYYCNTCHTSSKYTLLREDDDNSFYCSVCEKYFNNPPPSVC